MSTINWNEQAPLQLLQSMPPVLDKKNVEIIQKVIDVDKFVHSNNFNEDLCGIYAPFCDLCDKTVYCPCAQAYIKMKQAEGMQVEIAVAEDEQPVEEQLAEEQPAAQETINEDAVSEEPKKYYRIAVARSKKL